MTRIYHRPTGAFYDVSLDHLHDRDIPAARLTILADDGACLTGVVLGQMVSEAASAIEQAQRTRDLNYLQSMIPGDCPPPDRLFNAACERLIGGLEVMVAAA
jgi:hypothetical protein